MCGTSPLSQLPIRTAHAAEAKGASSMGAVYLPTMHVAKMTCGQKNPMVGIGLETNTHGDIYPTQNVADSPDRRGGPKETTLRVW
jgi:hypothetical protein